MKIQCDVCGREEASVFCCADEAALCTACDRRVHRANKLAGKHRRFSLLLSSTTPSATNPHAHPLCDICQEKRGFMFCKEDRAILCKDCDAPIHTANSLTMKHSRFLLTGARFSPAPINPSSPPPEPEEPEYSAPAITHKTKHDQDPETTKSDILTTSNSSTSTSTGSSISEYLINMLPGWRVEDLLVDDAAAVAAAAAAVDGICKTNDLLPFLEADMEFPIWVPHVPQIPTPNQHTATFSGGAGDYFQGLGAKDFSNPNRWSDDAFTVPEIPPASATNKRPRPSLWYF